MTIRTSDALAQSSALPPETTDLHILDEHHAAWSRETFGPDEGRGPQGPLKHMAQEIDECLAAPHDASEYADLLLLLLSAARRAGLSSHDLVMEGSRKLRLNHGRDWPDWRTRPKGEPVNHIKSPTEDDA